MVPDAINSAMEMVRNLGEGEIVVVDDASTDNTVTHLRSRYSSQLQDQSMKLVTLSQNLGVTGAKNAGVRHAKGEWVLFLDSDDLLIPETAPAIQQSLRDVPSDCPLFFFRCCDEDGRTVGPPQNEPFRLSTQKYLREGTPGECPPMLRRKWFLDNLYDEDLRGFEGLSYYRLISKIGPATVSPVTIRRYRMRHEERLSSNSGIEARASYLSRGNLRLLKIAYRNLSIRMTFVLAAKALYYLLLSIRYRIKRVLNVST